MASRLIEPFVRDLAQEDGYAHVGASGAGHFVKMVHNGIEYGMMQSLAEGFEIMRASELELDLRQLAALWQHGSVVRGWLLELLERAFAEDPTCAAIRGYVEDSGEGRWTVETAIDERVPAPADHPRAVLALRLPPGRVLRRQGERGAAQAVRRSRGEVRGATSPRSDITAGPRRIGGVCGGDELRSVAEEHLDAVYAFLLYLTGDRTVAEDLTGETFERALVRWRRFDPAPRARRRRGCASSRVPRRSTTFAPNRAADGARRRTRTKSWSRATTCSANGLSPELEAALHSLSPGEREVIALRVICELDGETAARVLGISRTACSTRLSRALRKLEEKVRDDVLA